MFQISFPEWNISLFTWLNQLNIGWLDSLMVFLSSFWSWIFLFVIVSFFMIRKSRFWGVREILLILCTVVINNVVNTLVKVLIQRPRPCQNEILDTIRVLEDCGDNYSFYSAHSSNAFCLAVCTALYFRNKYYTITILIWACAVAYSRIYVGKHYPLDILFGISLGVLMSFVGNWLLRRYREDGKIHIQE